MPNPQKFGFYLRQLWPYLTMWSAYVLTINSMISLWCRKEITGCVDDHGAEMNMTQNTGMFECPDGQMTVWLQVYVSVSVAIAFGIWMMQSYALYRKLSLCEFGSLELVVWAEVAKEKGSPFNTSIRLSVGYILLSTAVYIVTKGIKSNTDALGIAQALFQAYTAAVTSADLVTYDGPVRSVGHARKCPDVIFKYKWNSDSQTIIAALLNIISLDTETIEEIRTTTRRITHIDSDMVASLTTADLAAIRTFFKLPKGPPIKPVIETPGSDCPDPHCDDDDDDIICTFLEHLFISKHDLPHHGVQQRDIPRENPMDKPLGTVI